MKKDIFKVYIVQLLTIVVSFSSSILLSRILGAEGRGVFSLYQNSFNFAIVLFGFSLNSSIPYFINSLKVPSEKILFSAIKITLFSSLILSIILFFFDRFNLNHFSFPNEKIFYKIIFVSYFILQIIFSVITSILNAKKAFTSAAILLFLNLLIPLILYVSIYFNIIGTSEIASNLTIIIFSLLISSLLSTILATYILIKKEFIQLKFSLLNKADTKKFITYSSLAYISNIASFICYKFDFWIVDSYHGNSALGIYSLSSQLAQMLWILPQIMASVLYTYASSINKEEGVLLTIKIIKIGMYLTLVMAIIGVILSKPLIPILYGQEFSEVTYLLAIQLIGTIPFCIPTIISSFYASQGNFKVSFWISIIVTILAIFLYFILIPSYGKIGGSIASATTYFLGGIISLIYFCKRYKVNIKDIIFLKKEDLYSFVKMIKNK